MHEYYDVIPLADDITFEDIDKRVTNKHYRLLDPFLQDTSKCFQNCRAYHTEGEFLVSANRAEEKIKLLIEKYLPQSCVDRQAEQAGNADVGAAASDKLAIAAPADAIGEGGTAPHTEAEGAADTSDALGKPAADISDALGKPAADTSDALGKPAADTSDALGKPAADTSHALGKPAAAIAAQGDAGMAFAADECQVTTKAAEESSVAVALAPTTADGAATPVQMSTGANDDTADNTAPTDNTAPRSEANGADTTDVAVAAAANDAEISTNPTSATPVAVEAKAEAELANPTHPTPVTDDAVAKIPTPSAVSSSTTASSQWHGVVPTPAAHAARSAHPGAAVQLPQDTSTALGGRALVLERSFPPGIPSHNTTAAAATHASQEAAYHHAHQANQHVHAIIHAQTMLQAQAMAQGHPNIPQQPSGIAPAYYGLGLYTGGWSGNAFGSAAIDPEAAQRLAQAHAAHAAQNGYMVQNGVPLHLQKALQDQLVQHQTQQAGCHAAEERLTAPGTPPPRARVTDGHHPQASAELRRLADANSRGLKEDIAPAVSKPAPVGTASDDLAKRAPAHVKKTITEIQLVGEPPKIHSLPKGTDFADMYKQIIGYYAQCLGVQPSNVPLGLGSYKLKAPVGAEGGKVTSMQSKQFRYIWQISEWVASMYTKYVRSESSPDNHLLDPQWARLVKLIDTYRIDLEDDLMNTGGKKMAVTWKWFFFKSTANATTAKEHFGVGDTKFGSIEERIQKLNQSLDIFNPHQDLGDTDGDGAPKHLTAAPRPPVVEEVLLPYVKPADAGEESYSDALKKLGLDGPPKDTRECELCSELGDQSSELGGRLIPIQNGEWIHINCAMWSAECFEDADGGLVNVGEARKRGRLMKCTSCKEAGATVGCGGHKSCKTNYHFPCATKNNAKFLPDRSLRCVKHTGEDQRAGQDGYGEVARQTFVLVDEGVQQGKHRRSKNIMRTLLPVERIEGLKLRMGSFAVHAFGTIFKRSGYHNQSYIYPVDYVASRSFWSLDDVKRRVSCLETDRCYATVSFLPAFLPTFLPSFLPSFLFLP